MDKPRLTRLAKARIDEQTKLHIQQLTFAFYPSGDEADTVRAALREFIANHADALPALPQIKMLTISRRPIRRTTNSRSRLALS